MKPRKLQNAQGECSNCYSKTLKMLQSYEEDQIKDFQ